MNPASNASKTFPAPARRRAGRAAARMLYDELDRRIIGLLQKDGRRPNTEIAQILGVTETTVRKRIGRLLSEDLMKVVAVPSPEVVGMTMSAIIGITVDMGRNQEVADALVAMPQTRYAGFSTGSYDIIIEVFFRSHEELLHLMAEELTKVPGIVKAEASVILKVAKFAHEWEVPDEVLAGG